MRSSIGSCGYAACGPVVARVDICRMWSSIVAQEYAACGHVLNIIIQLLSICKVKQTLLYKTLAETPVNPNFRSCRQPDKQNFKLQQSSSRGLVDWFNEISHASSRTRLSFESACSWIIGSYRKSLLFETINRRQQTNKQTKKQTKDKD